jgi:SAM-dependent methyltransferase
LNKLGASSDSFIHNTSWGFSGCHVLFKNDLDNIYKNTLHSDVIKSNFDNTMVYDITKKIEDKFLNCFDYVLNISTVEEVNSPNVEVIKNLFEQVKQGGYLILTFDYDSNSCNTYGNGSINLTEVEDYVGQKCKGIDELNLLNCRISLIPSNCDWMYNLNCGLLVIQKI